MTPRVSRPRAHFTPASGWINDPHGITVVDGRYHLFFQHVPGSTQWQPNCHWGHAVSDDLTTWETLPIALAPGDGDDGVWSGSITVDDDGDALAYYTSVQVPEFGIGRVRVARPTDDGWEGWEKGDVVAELPAELDAVAFRDPFVFRDGDRWRMLVGASLRGGVAAAVSFSSADRLAWTYDGLAAQRPGESVDPVWTGTLWECPQIFEIDGRHVLVTSVWEDDVLHYVAYAVGEYADGRFIAAEWHRLTYGDSYYAPTFFRDRDGQPCLTFWLRGAADEGSGWASAHSVPHLLSLEGDQLVAELHPEAREGISALERDSRGNDPELLSWEPEDEEVRIVSEAGRVVTLRRQEDAVEVTDGDERSRLPGVGDRRATLLVDGPVLEVLFGTASYAFCTDSDLSVHGRSLA